MTRLPERRTITDPMSLMDDFSAYMNRMMGPYFSPLATGEGSWTPLSDVSEKPEAYHVDIELPGVAREDVTVDIEGQELTVTGEFHREDHGGRHRAPFVPPRGPVRVRPASAARRRRRELRGGADGRRPVPDDPEGGVRGAPQDRDQVMPKARGNRGPFVCVQGALSKSALRC